jgi:DNA-directed RNA polymerase specialized sigma24 family protein
MAGSLDIATLYDDYSSRVYALALRITGDRDAAADIVEDLFVGIGDGSLVHDRRRGGSFDAWLLRTARDAALARREAQSPLSSVHQSEATPRSLVEAAFFGGMSATELAKMYSLGEDEVRRRLCNGMAELRTQFVTAPR